MFGIGFIIGPILGGLLGDHWVRLPFIEAAVLNTCNPRLALFILPESRTRTGQKIDLASLNPLLPLRWVFSRKGLLPIILVYFYLGTAGESPFFDGTSVSTTKRSAPQIYVFRSEATNFRAEPCINSGFSILVYPGLLQSSAAPRRARFLHCCGLREQPELEPRQFGTPLKRQHRGKISGRQGERQRRIEQKAKEGVSTVRRLIVAQQRLQVEGFRHHDKRSRRRAGPGIHRAIPVKFHAVVVRVSQVDSLADAVVGRAFQRNRWRRSTGARRRPIRPAWGRGWPSGRGPWLSPVEENLPGSPRCSGQCDDGTRPPKGTRRSCRCERSLQSRAHRGKSRANVPDRTP